MEESRDLDCAGEPHLGVVFEEGASSTTDHYIPRE
jgi:hypothetical protein